MQGICGAFSSELLANWVGALGSAGAAILAVVLYWVDKRGQRRREREARDVVRKGQAIHIVALLEPIERQLAEMEVASKIDTSAPPAFLMVAGPEKLLDALRDPAVFSMAELTSIAEVVSATGVVNRAIAIHTVRSGDAEFVLTKELPTRDIEYARGLCVECVDRMLAIANPTGVPKAK